MSGRNFYFLHLYRLDVTDSTVQFANPGGQRARGRIWWSPKLVYSQFVDVENIPKGSWIAVFALQISLNASAYCNKLQKIHERLSGKLHKYL